MGDVVSIEVDGELGPPPLDGDRRPPRAGMPLAVVLVVGLVGAVGWTVRRPASPPPSAASVPTTLVSTTTTSVALTTTVAPAEPGPIEGAQAALDAWGRFAGSGDLGELRSHFAPDGEQLAQLRLQAGAVAVGEPYRVRLENPSAHDDGDGMTVIGDVVWTRAGEPEQRYRWAIELQRAPVGWLLTTVRTVD